MGESLCPICNKLVWKDGVYCKNHQRAYLEIKKKYAKWQEAYDSISWERYLETIRKVKETGELAKEVADEELRLAKFSQFGQDKISKTKTDGATW